MKNIVALKYQPPILEKIIIVGDQFARCISGWSAAAPRLFIYFGERICNIV